MKQPKPKKCKQCERLFTPYKTTAIACSLECAIELTNKANTKKWKIDKAKKKKELMTLSDWLKIAQVNFNKFIRLRDAKENCISCGGILRKGNIDAGHYYSAGGHYNVRFHELNCHSQCSRPCNKDRAGDLINYRLGLIERIGQDKLTELESIAHVTRKFTIEEVKEINELYKTKIKEL